MVVWYGALCGTGKAPRTVACVCLSVLIYVCDARVCGNLCITDSKVLADARELAESIG